LVKHKFIIPAAAAVSFFVKDVQGYFEICPESWQSIRDATNNGVLAIEVINQLNTSPPGIMTMNLPRGMGPPPSPEAANSNSLPLTAQPQRRRLNSNGSFTGIPSRRSVARGPNSNGLYVIPSPSTFPDALLTTGRAVSSHNPSEDEVLAHLSDSDERRSQSTLSSGGNPALNQARSVSLI
jgi:hypothetical protein